MYLKLILCVIVVASDALGGQYTPGENEYLLEALSPVLSVLKYYVFDGPANITNAPTEENRNELPSVDQMMYYNYYCAATYDGYGLENLDCEYCKKFKDSVVYHQVLNNTEQNTLALATLSINRSEIVIAFRGTWNAWNVVTDGMITVRSEPDNPQVKVHQGFRMATMSLFYKVVAIIKKLLIENPGFKVVLTGHSLGGAMASLTYYFITYRQLFPNATFEVYTYGEPRVGNKYFADFMNCQRMVTARVVARADIIPHFMPASVVGTKILGDNTLHRQTEFWINGTCGQKFCSRVVYEDPECSMSMGPAYSLFDHFFYFDANYLRAAGQLLQIAALPFGVLDPLELPPLPTPIANVVGGIIGGGGRALDGPLG